MVTATASTDWREWRARVAEAARQNAPILLKEWLPEGRLQGDRYTVGSLTGQDGKSLVIWTGEGKGNWKDFARDDDKGSNLVSLYARLKGIQYRDANDELADRFKIAKPEFKRVNKWQPLPLVPEVAPYGDDGLPAIDFNIPGDIQGWWTYLNGEGAVIYHRVRFLRPGSDKKDFWPVSFCTNAETGEAKWQPVDQRQPRPLYGLELLAGMPEVPVLFVEGEKSADAARILLPDWIVVTAGSSAITAKSTDFTPLLTRTSRIVIWPDNDRAGLRLAAELALILKNAEIVQPDPSWREHWDLADGLEEGWDTAKTLTFLDGHLVKPEAPAADRPDIDISGADLEQQSQAIWTAVKQYDRGPELVHTPAGLSIVRRELGRASKRLMDLASLRHWLTLRFRMRRFNKDGDMVSTRPDENLLANLLVHTKTALPNVTRVTETPILASDGRLIDQEGLDLKSGIYYLPAPGFEKWEPFDLLTAVAIVDDLLSDFPFMEPTDKAHAVAFALTPIIRMTIKGRTPMFRFEAPQPRTGKTLLMRLLARLTCMTISDLGPAKDDEEWRKRLTAALREEPDALLFDNIETLEFPSVKKLLTDDIWQERVLQTSTTLRAKVECVFGASVNNPAVSAEIMGRSLRVRLDAKSEHPETGRVFKHRHIEEYAAEQRPMLYSAFLAIAMAATEPDPNAPTLGGYEPFCRRLAAILDTAGYTGFLGDRSDESALSEDEASFKFFIREWANAYGTDRKTTTELLWIAERSELYLGKSDKDESKARMLGWLITRHRGNTFGDWRLCDASTHTRNGKQWWLIHKNGHMEITSTMSQNEGL